MIVIMRIPLLVLGLSLISSAGYAAPSVMKVIKGIGDVTNEITYNPIYGAIAAPYIKGIRYFGNYTQQENPHFKCIVKDQKKDDGSLVPNNCPSDHVTTLIQWLFPNANEFRIENIFGNFEVNERDMEDRPDLVSKLLPSTIGAILNEIYKAQGKYDINLVKNIQIAIAKD